jgi:GTPase SAR1 family protein
MTLKICIIGESGVGKTSLINRFTKNKFSSQYRITVGADLFSHEMTVDDNEYSLQVHLIEDLGHSRTRKVPIYWVCLLPR